MCVITVFLFVIEPTSRYREKHALNCFRLNFDISIMLDILYQISLFYFYFIQNSNKIIRNDYYYYSHEVIEGRIILKYVLYISFFFRKPVLHQSVLKNSHMKKV